MCFTDYARPSMRLAALMKIPTIFVMTHDSIGLGEDGPTHQPVEHLAISRATPNTSFFDQQTVLKQQKHGNWLYNPKARLPFSP